MAESLRDHFARIVDLARATLYEIQSSQEIDAERAILSIEGERLSLGYPPSLAPHFTIGLIAYTTYTVVAPVVYLVIFYRFGLYRRYWRYVIISRLQWLRVAGPCSVDRSRATPRAVH